MLNADLIFFTDSSMNIGGQELQALQQMHSLNQIGFECILLCKPHSAISKRARDQGITLQEIFFRNFVLLFQKKYFPLKEFCLSKTKIFFCFFYILLYMTKI